MRPAGRSPATRPPAGGRTGGAAPPDAEARRAAAPVVVYAADALPPPASAGAPGPLVETVGVPPREGRCIRVPRGATLRISTPYGSQVGDLNLWADGDLAERHWSGKTRALHGTHVTTGDRLWSCLPHLRPMATILHDSLAWYGTDAHGCRVHDVIGTRCDPYTHALLTGGDRYHHCCHSNLTRALANFLGVPDHEAEPHVHDVVNVFMCTGFDARGKYVMKASPARAGDRLDLRAEFGLVAGLSACPGGDCGATHSSDAAECHPLRMEVFAAPGEARPAPARAPYDRSHGR